MTTSIGFCKRALNKRKTLQNGRESPLIQVSGDNHLLTSETEKNRGFSSKCTFSEKNAHSMKKFQTIFFIMTDDKFLMHSTGAKLGLLNL